MIFKTLKVCDFRVFNGEHTFELAPKIKYGEKRPIILFGGLNGSGKTTILTAVRLCLYGRHSLGDSVSLREYHNYLTDSIHKNNNAIVPNDSASIELTFTYARQGSVSDYSIKRYWIIKGKDKVEETLKIYQDGIFLSEFNHEQCQAFLNELIPIGVSELFFFDGEKIAKLAEDDSGEILNHAVRKLLGLDLIERLKNDLSVYLRRQNTKLMPNKLQEKIKSLEVEYEKLLQQKETELSKVDQLQSPIDGLNREISEIENRLNNMGGAWAKTRQSETQRIDDLKNEREKLLSQIYDLLKGVYPLRLSINSLDKLVKKLDKESDIKRRRLLKEELRCRIEPFATKISHSLGADVAQHVVEQLSEQFSDILDSEYDIDKQLPHDISDSTLSRFHLLIDELLPEAYNRLISLRTMLERVEEDIATSSIRIERAPDEDSLQADFDLLKSKNNDLAELKAKVITHKENAKRLIRDSLDYIRQIKKLQDDVKNSTSINDATINASNTKDLLDEFSSLTAQQRVKELEYEFNKCYKQLARKEDVNIHAKIDPISFGVSLVDNSGNSISKKDMSAGEKQIYAIAILEALAKTSGRRLPVIIDTPLGRLDSKHRNKLVQNYFPHASHQVIILSTDTEVDRNFYKDMSPEISRVYQIQYDVDTGSSIVEEGYFWRKESYKEIANATR